MTMNRYNFTIQLSGRNHDHSTLEDNIWSGCGGDATILTREGVATILFSREADTPQAALAEAYRDIHMSGYTVYSATFDDEE